VAGCLEITVDFSITKFLVLAVIAVVVFGPDQLPRIAAQAGRALRELRRLADGAKEDLREGLGAEFADLDLSDLNPRTLVRKHLLDGFNLADLGLEADPRHDFQPASAMASLEPGEEPPYDFEAT
jgi:sec-independent protein translocase protein TatB